MQARTSEPVEPAAVAAAGYTHFAAAVASSVGSAAFARNQNRTDRQVLGGPIHWSKAAWLNLTVLCFVVLPFLWWRASTVSPAMRRVQATLFTSFALRGLVEFHLIYVSRSWKCGYGISHDALAAAMMAGQLVQLRDEFVPEQDRRALAFSALTLALLVAEGNFARMFRAVQDPATGIYFADDSPKFRRVVRVTKLVVFTGYPLLALIMWKARRDFPPRGRRRPW